MVKKNDGNEFCDAKDSGVLDTSQDVATAPVVAENPNATPGWIRLTDASTGKLAFIDVLDVTGVFEHSKGSRIERSGVVEKPLIVSESAQCVVEMVCKS